MMKPLLCLLVATALLVGCVTSGPNLGTASGQPESHILKLNAEAYRGMLLNRWVDKGFTIVKNDPAQIVVERPSNSFATDLFFGSRYDTTSFYRLRVNFIPKSEEEMRIIGGVSIVGNRGSAFERETPMGGKYAAELQDVLDMVRLKFANSR